jgi:hypothetical protein
MFLRGMAGEAVEDLCWRPQDEGAVSSGAGNIAIYNKRNTTSIYLLTI